MATYEYVASVTVGSGGADYIEFTSIPVTYRHFIAHVSARSNSTNVNSQSRINNNTSTATVYPYTQLYAFGSPANLGSLEYHDISAEFRRSMWMSSDGNIANAFGVGWSLWIRPTDAGIKRMFLQQAYAPETGAALNTQTYNLTSAVTSWQFYPDQGISAGKKWNQYSRVTLYGLKNS